MLIKREQIKTMALLETPEKDSHFQAVGFSLKGTDGKIHTLNECMGDNGLLVLFICNHCPYVKAIIERVVEDCTELQKAGIGCVAIMSNDVTSHPEDSFENMQIFADENNFTFPYLIDETQDIAKAYGAVCTPDIYGFNIKGTLQYRGRIDNAGMKELDSVIKREMYDAMIQIAKTSIGPSEQFPSMGCSIKWKQ